jgi:hypothetical protein
MCVNKKCSKIHVREHLSYNFLIRNGRKQKDALSPLLFYFALEYAIRKAQENRMELRFNGTHQLLVYADVVNLLEDNIYIYIL